MSLKSKLQEELKKRGYLSVSDVMDICSSLKSERRPSGYLYDTGRNSLEPKKTPFAKKDYHTTGTLRGWFYRGQIRPQEPIVDVLPQNTSQSPLFKLEPLKAIKKRHYEYN